MSSIISDQMIKLKKIHELRAITLGQFSLPDTFWLKIEEELEEYKPRDKVQLNFMKLGDNPYQVVHNFISALVVDVRFSQKHCCVEILSRPAMFSGTKGVLYSYMYNTKLIARKAT